MLLVRLPIALLGIFSLGNCSNNGGRAQASSETVKSEGPVKITAPDGTVMETTGPTTVTTKSVVAEQPENPVKSAAVSLGETITADTGSSQPTDAALAGLGFYPLAGLALMVLGTCSWVLRFKFRFIPKYLGPALILLGIGVAAFTVMLDRYAWIGAVAAVIAILGGIAWALYRMGVFQRGLDGTMAGVQAFKQAHPESKHELNAALAKEQQRRGHAAQQVIHDLKEGKA